MEALLIEQWLGDCADTAVSILDDAAVSVARDAVRARGAAIGLDALAIEAAASAVSELARNQLRHAGRGVIGLRAVARGRVPGLEIVAADRGPGIADPTTALLGAPRPSGGLGVGLSAAHRLLDELDLDVRWGEGTCVRGRKFAAPVVRREIAVLGRACPGEAISGDHAAVMRDDDTVTIAVCDGLGHGRPARLASDLAVGEALRHPALAPAALLDHCDRALAGTRGGVMSVARLGLVTGELEHAGVGNVTSRVFRHDGVRGLRAVAGTLGGTHGKSRLQSERVKLAAGELLVMVTDGITSRAALPDPAMLRKPPMVVAHHLMTHFARDNDDVLIAVAT